MKVLLALAAVLFATATTAQTSIVVVSYTYLQPTPTTAGYRDSGGELIDGIDLTTAWATGKTITLADVVPLTGWDQFRNPTIRFQFAGPTTVRGVTTWFADSNSSAGVGLPGSLNLRTDDRAFSRDFTINDPAGAGSRVPSVFSGFAVTTDHLIVEGEAAHYWTMLSEVTFSSVPIPEPAHLALLLGFVALWSATRRRL